MCYFIMLDTTILLCVFSNQFNDKNLFYLFNLNWTAKETCHFCPRPHVKIYIYFFFLHTGIKRLCCIPLTNHNSPKQVLSLNKEEIGMISNLVTESKVTECNRMSLKIFTQKSMPIFTTASLYTY